MKNKLKRVSTTDSIVIKIVGRHDSGVKQGLAQLLLG